MSSSASGLALSIRKAEDSETFDLGGQSQTTISNTVKAAFGEPLPLKEMIRITLVTGAGKQARQKYDEGAARAVTTALRELGYEEDRAASCIEECGGTFKLQHDTGKNLKTVVVFPKISGSKGNDGVGGNNDTTIKDSLVPAGCPAYKIAMSSVNTFERMLQSQCPSWSQKKGCFAALEHLKHMVDDLDAKLMRGVPLDDAEQDFYDQVTGLDDKLAYTKDEMHKQVEDGGITKFEKETLLEHNAERLAALANDMKGANGKKMEKLKVMQEKALNRKELLQGIEPKPPHKLKHEQAIARLWKEAVPLLQLEEKTKGRLLSVKETQSMARKDEIMEEIEELEEACRGWFEDEEVFEWRCKTIRATFTAKLKQQSKPKKTYASATGGSSNSGKSKPMAPIGKERWLTPGSGSKKNTSAWGSAGGKKKKTHNSDVFAAMMAKSTDSDSDDNDDSQYQHQGNTNTSKHVPDDGDRDEEDLTPSKAQEKVSSKENDGIQTNTDSGKKKAGKKKNRKSKGKKKDFDMSEDELLDVSAAANAAAAKKKAEEDNQVSHPAIVLLKDYLVPFVLGLIAWIVGIFFGKPKQKKR